MVKKMDDYENRMNDARFEKFDKLIAHNSNDKKFTLTLTVGIVICFAIMGSTMYIDSQNPATLMKYDHGLNISYSPVTSTYFIDYTNPNDTARYMMVNIGIMMTPDVYSTVFSKEVTAFPANISYTPSEPDYMHRVSVNLVKETGNYTYFYSNIPSDDNKMYEGIFKYLPDMKDFL